jgi:hypothetical protein
MRTELKNKLSEKIFRITVLKIESINNILSAIEPLIDEEISSQVELRLKLKEIREKCEEEYEAGNL